MVFTPKPYGYNAKYCSDKCKLKFKKKELKKLRKLKPEKFRAARARSYAKTKQYPDRMEGHLASARKSQNKTRTWLSEYKSSQGCVDCGYNAHPAALQLDHEGVKSIEIADARSSIRRLQEEIESGNCKVRCANCHSIRTWERKQRTKITTDMETI